MTGLATVFTLGALAQWVAYKIRIPSILLLLATGVVAGPLLHWVDPDAILGPMLFPIVSISVAFILFEGGMTLKFSELKEVGGAVRGLVTVGPVVAWLTTSAAAVFLADLSLPIAFLVGGILVVTGPTVIIPLLHNVRPKGRVASVIRWEGIVNDPIGAVIAVLVFEAALEFERHGAMGHGLTAFMVEGVLKTALVGVGLGVGIAYLLVEAFRTNGLPDHLDIPVTCSFVVGSFVASNAVQEESGLLTVTVMGMALANQRRASTRHILEFQEHLRTLLISVLFILLSARLKLSDLAVLDGGSLLFLLALIFVIRPLTIFLSTWGSGLTLEEKLFTCWMAPRGIVAAAVASVFAMHLSQAGVEEAREIVPLIFLVIVGTVLLYGLTAKMVAQRLGLAERNPQGALFLGAHKVARTLAHALRKRGVPVLLLDRNWGEISKARIEGLRVRYGDAFSESTHHSLDLDGIGKLFALTRNDEVNALACVRFHETFGRAGIFQIAPAHAIKDGFERPIDLHGRYLFGSQFDHEVLANRLNQGFVIKYTQITEKFTMESFFQHHGRNSIPLFLLDEEREEPQLEVFTEDTILDRIQNRTLVALVREGPEALTSRAPKRSKEDGLGKSASSPPAGPEPAPESESKSEPESETESVSASK